MTDADAKALRDAAEAVVTADYGVSSPAYDDACEAFNLAASPAVVLLLLAEREDLRAALRSLAGLSNELTWKPSTRPYADRMQRVIRAALIGNDAP